MITTTLLLPLLTTPGLPQETAAAPPTPHSRTVEDLEVLRRLFVQEISGRATDSELPVFSTSDTGVGYTVLSNEMTFGGAAGKSVPHSRAFHIPGQGGFFSLDVQLPIIEAETGEPKEEVAEKSEAEKEWERIREEVRTGVSSRRTRIRTHLFFDGGEEDDREWKIDPEAIRTVEDDVLRVLSRHAGRIEDLSNSEHLTVALHLTGSESSFVVRTQEDGEECTSIGWLSGALAARRAPAQRLVIRVSMADLRRGDLNGGSKLREGALIHAY